MNEYRFNVSIIIPCRNEERYIEKCIDSVLSFEIPEDTIIKEIFLIDGNSTDNTCTLIKKYLDKDKRFILLNNSKIIQSCALNIGIKKSSGNYILRLDAHAQYPKNYLSLLTETSKRVNVENVGGTTFNAHTNGNSGQTTVQALTTHRFGVGNSGFRTGMTEQEADTVPYGFFKKEIFEKIGYFDERLVRTQDYEFNRRIKKYGGKIWFNPSIQVYYYNQPNLKTFLEKQFLKEAPYNAYMWYVAPYTFVYRHAITGIFSLGIIGGFLLSLFFYPIYVIYWLVIMLYFVLAIFSSIQQSYRYKKIYLLFYLPFSFFLYHFIHGLGVWLGLLKIISGTSPVQKTTIRWEGSEYFISTKIH